MLSFTVSKLCGYDSFNKLGWGIILNFSSESSVIKVIVVEVEAGEPETGDITKR